MRDICLISRDAGQLMKMRACPAECGTVDMYERSHQFYAPQVWRTSDTYAYIILMYEGIQG